MIINELCFPFILYIAVVHFLPEVGIRQHKCITMKKLAFVTPLILYALSALSQRESCYAGVYLNQDDFLANRLSYKIDESIKGEKLHFQLPADIKMTVKIVTPDSSVKFKPGSIYGYAECGDVYRYSAGTEIDAQQDFYKIEEAKDLIIYSSMFISGNEIFYSRSLTSPIHRLNLKNLEVDFKDSPDFITAVKKINKDVDNGLATKDKDGIFIINKIYHEILGPRYN